MNSDGSSGLRGVAEALRLADACLDYLNSAEAAGLGGSACGEVLVALGAIQAKLTAAFGGAGVIRAT